MDLLEEYLKKWNLTSPELLVATFSSHVYKVQYKNETAVLKIFTPIGLKFESKSGSSLVCFNGQGAVRLFIADEGAHLLEFIEGASLHSTVQDFDSDKTALHVIADIVDKLHSYNGSIPKELCSLEQNFQSLFDYVKKNPSDELFALGAEVAKGLLATEKDIRVLHGDIHHKNIMQSSERGWVAIDPASIYGERTYDLANSFFNPFDMPHITETKEHIESCLEVFTERFQLQRQRLLEFAFAFGCLSTVWCIEDGISPDRRLRSTKLIYQVLFGSRYP